MIPLNHLLRELFAERTRVLLTILAIAWGTASITTMLSLGEGLRQVFGRSMRGIGEGILIVAPGQTSRAYNGLPEGQRLALERLDLEAVRQAVPEIAALSGEHMDWRPMRQGDKWRTGRLMGVDPDYGLMRNMFLEPGGRFVDPLDLSLRRRVAVIGPQVARELFGEGVDPVGRYMDIDGRPFLVVGLLRKKFQTTTFGGPDRDGTWIPSTTFESMYDRRHYSYVIARPADLAAMEHAKARLRQVVAGRRGLDPGDEEILRYWDILEMQRVSGRIFSGLQIVFGVIGGLTLVVAGVGIANVMYVSVSGATREIGVRMAVGARPRQVLAQYVLESLIATGLGGLLGLAAARALVWLVEQVPMEGDFFEFVGRPVPVLSAEVALMVVAVLGIVGGLSGFFPARRAAQVDPAEALRCE